MKEAGYGEMCMGWGGVGWGGVGWGGVGSVCIRLKSGAVGRKKGRDDVVR